MPESTNSSSQVSGNPNLKLIDEKCPCVSMKLEFILFLIYTNGLLFRTTSTSIKVFNNWLWFGLDQPISLKHF